MKKTFIRNIILTPASNARAAPVCRQGLSFKEFRTLAEDPGRFLITGERKDWKAFRTPTLREIAGTAPYMHNGISATLDEAIEFFNAGGGKGNTVLTPLQLTAEENDSSRFSSKKG